MNILITGAYGFIGNNISNYLKESYTLWALDVTEKNNNAYSKYYSWDDLDKIPWNSIDIIIHLAGIAHDIKKSKKNEDYFLINTDLTKIIFDYFLKSNASQFYFFSTVKAAADKVENNILTEDVIPKPVGPYGESKRKAEEYILNKQWNKKYVYIFRPCMVHGPGNKGNLNSLYNIVSKGIPYPLGAFDNKRSYLNITNLNFIINKFIEICPDSGIYNLADDEPVSTNRIIELISVIKNRPPKILKINKNIIKYTANIGTWLKLPINNEKLVKLTENYIVSNKKMKSILSIGNLPMIADDGFKLTFKSFENKK